MLYLAIVLIIINPQLSTSASEQPKRVAILPFSFNNVTDDVGDVDVGAEIAKVLSARIATMPGWIAAPQEDVSTFLQRDDAVNLSAVEIGRALNVDAIIIGTVQSFELQTGSNTGAAAADTAVSAASAAAYTASSYVPYVNSVAGLLYRIPSSSGYERGHAKVVLEATIIDVDSGKDISTLNGTAISKKKATDLWGQVDPNTDFLSPSFTNCIAGQATLSAIDAMCKQLANISPQIDALAANRVQGIITDVDDDLISVNVGKTDGFKVGDKFIVERESASSEQTNTRMGVISITDIGEQTSLAKLVNGTTPFIGNDIRNQAISSTNM